MLILEKPYFMSNPEWYTEVLCFESEDGRGYHLTDKAPKEAIASYEEFYATLEGGIGQEGLQK